MNVAAWVGPLTSSAVSVSPSASVSFVSTPLVGGTAKTASSLTAYVSLSAIGAVFGARTVRLTVAGALLVWLSLAR